LHCECILVAQDHKTGKNDRKESGARPGGSNREVVAGERRSQRALESGGRRFGEGRERKLRFAARGPARTRVGLSDRRGDRAPQRWRLIDDGVDLGNIHDDRGAPRRRGTLGLILLLEELRDEDS
jgi:hypothetical protein